MIETIRHIINEEQDGELIRVDRIEYEFSEGVSDEAKDAVRSHVPRLRSKDDVRRVIESVDSEDQ